MFYFEKPKVRDVFLYRRQSLDEDDPRQTHSLPLQDQFCREFAERMDLKIIDEFIDDASAKTPNNRPNFTRMLKELALRNPNKRRADGILAWHPDRLSRNGEEAGKIVQMISDDLIKGMYFPVYHFHNDPSGIEHLMMEFGRAISYSGWLSINSKRGSTGREQQGAWVYGRSKFGYTKLREVPQHPKRCSLFPIPDKKTFPARKRLVELWLASTPDEECSKIIKREFGLTLGRSTVSDLRRDSFNYGVYVIKPGEKDERKVDFRELCAPDGTPFTPVTDEESFWKFQSFVRKEQPTRKKSKHLNPLQGRITCPLCGTGMRPARRNIRRAGHATIKELGYECQTVHSNKSRCPQSRIRASVIYDNLAEAISAKFGVLDKANYHQYVIGLNRFIGNKAKTDQTRRGKRTKRIQKLEKEKAAVIEKKLCAIRSYQYDDETRQWVNRRLKEINRDLSEFAEEAKTDAAASRSRVKSFRQFIELKENLHHYWLAANEDQKSRLAKLLLLNLEGDASKNRSITWSTAAREWPKTPENMSGGGYRHKLELYFDQLWKAFFLKMSEQDRRHTAENSTSLKNEIDGFIEIPSHSSTESLVNG